jgi:hypothetical protein
MCPVRTCLATLRVKPFTVSAGTCASRDSAIPVDQDVDHNGPDRLEAGALGDVMLQRLVEALGLPDVLALERIAVLVLDHRLQCGERGLHVADHP